MEAISHDITSSEAGVATDMQVEEDEASTDRINSTEGWHKACFPRNKNLCYVPIRPL